MADMTGRVSVHGRVLFPYDMWSPLRMDIPHTIPGAVAAVAGYRASAVSPFPDLV